jgi:hypothetical protein
MVPGRQTWPLTGVLASQPDRLESEKIANIIKHFWLYFMPLAEYFPMILTEVMLIVT